MQPVIEDLASLRELVLAAQVGRADLVLLPVRRRLVQEREHARETGVARVAREHETGHREHLDVGVDQLVDDRLDIAAGERFDGPSHDLHRRHGVTLTRAATYPLSKPS